MSEGAKPTTSNVSIIATHLKSWMGDLAEQFLAIELSKVNRKYVTLENTTSGVSVAFPQQIPQVNQQDLTILLGNLDEALKLIVGPGVSKVIIGRIQQDLTTMAMNT